MPEVAPGAVGHAAYDSILRQLESAEVGIIGPGLGRDSSTWRLVVDLALHAQSPLVIDADGLNALADSPRSKGKLGARRVLTPHPGELARLTGKTADAINADRPGAARNVKKALVIDFHGVNALVTGAAAVLLGFAGFDVVGYDYMEHNNGFCTGCHVMKEPFQRFAGSKHDSLSCHACHQQSMYANARQLYLWVAERPEKIGKHAKAKSMAEHIDETIHSIRRIATELRPGLLDTVGLLATRTLPRREPAMPWTSAKV